MKVQESRRGTGGRNANLEGGPERSSAERSEAERSVGAASKFDAARPAGQPGDSPRSVPDPEVSDRPKRRQFTVEYKLAILKQADACREPGELGALLRREGLYSSSLSAWRRQREQGTLGALKPKKRGRKAKPVNPLAGRVAELERENRQLKRKLDRAETIIEFQKKLSEILGIPLKPQESEGGEP